MSNLANLLRAAVVLGSIAAFGQGCAVQNGEPTEGATGATGEAARCLTCGGDPAPTPSPTPAPTHTPAPTPAPTLPVTPGCAMEWVSSQGGAAGVDYLTSAPAGLCTYASSDTTYPSLSADQQEYSATQDAFLSCVGNWMVAYGCSVPARSNADFQVGSATHWLDVSVCPQNTSYANGNSVSTTSIADFQSHVSLCGAGGFDGMPLSIFASAPNYSASANAFYVAYDPSGSCSHCGAI